MNVQKTIIKHVASSSAIQTGAERGLAVMWKYERQSPLIDSSDRRVTRQAK